MRKLIFKSCGKEIFFFPVAVKRVGDNNPAFIGSMYEGTIAEVYAGMSNEI